MIQYARQYEGKKQCCAVCVLKNDLQSIHSCNGTGHRVSEIPTGVLVKIPNAEEKYFCKYGELLYNCKKDCE